MNIEFRSEFGGDIAPEIITIDIDENLPIEALLSKICEYIDIELYKEVTWEGKKEKIARLCYYKTYPNEQHFTGINDLQEKINSFPKSGKNGELSIYIDISNGKVN
jgi:hypothetical protein